MPTADVLTPTVIVAHRPRPGHASQDRHLVFSGAVAVIDGATDPDRPPNRDGGWYAEQLTRAVAARIGELSLDLVQVAEQAIAEVAARHQLTPGSSPSSTLTMLRWTGPAVPIEALVLADTALVVRGLDDSVSVYCDTRIDVFAAEPHAAYRDRLSLGFGYDEDHKRLMRELGTFLSDGRNRPGGFWVAEADPRAACEAITFHLDPASVRDVAILTDGASAAVDTYGLFPDWGTALDMISKNGPAALLQAVRDTEVTDLDARCWPRSKPHDDATVVYLDFTASDAEPAPEVSKS